MDNLGELIPTGIGEGQKLAQPVIVPTPEHQVEKPNPLIGRLAEVKANAHSHFEKAVGLVDGKSSETNPEKQINSLDARAQLEELANNATTEPSEYLSKSKQALTASSQFRDKTTAELQTLQDSWNRPYFAGRDIGERIEQLDQTKGLRRIPAALEKRRLIIQKAAIDTQLEQLNGQMHAKRQLVDQLTEQEGPVRLKQAELLLEEIGKEVQAIRVEYEKLSGEILQDGTTTGEIREAYIRSVISPQVDKVAEEKKYPDDRKQGFYTALNNFLDHRDEPQEQQQQYRQELDQYFNYDNGFYYVRDACETLLRGGDKQIIQGLVVSMAATDIAPIKAAVEPSLNYDQRYKFSAVFNKAIEPSDRWSRDEHSFGSQLLSRFDQYSGSSGYADMNLWNALKSSKTANGLFGEAIRERDVGIYTTALDKSLSDTNGGDIDMLYYYPTPDAIRNLVVIAAADRQEYRTVHANWTLDSLSKRPEWSQLLDEAEKTHPSLKAARETLEKWNYREYANHPDIQSVAGDLAATLFEDPSVDKRLTTLATLSLRNDAIVNILGKRNVLNEQEAQSIGEAITFLRETSEETYNRSRDNDYKTPYVSDYSFSSGLRENLFYLLRPEGSVVDPSRLAVIQRFDALSRQVLQNKEDFTKLNYLMSSSVVDRIKNPSTSIDNLPAFFDAYKTCPELLKNSNLLGEFCRQYEGEQSVLFFRDIVTAYQGSEKQLDQIVPLVGKKVLSQERALELPTIAKDVLESPSFSLAVEFPKLYLETNDGLEFFTQTRSGSLFSLGESLEARIGERIRALQGSGDLKFSELLVKIAPSELDQLDKLLSSGQPIEAGQLKWQQLLMGYVRANSQMWGLPKLSEVSTERINTLFNDPKVRDACLKGLRDQWITYLKSGKPEEVPFSLNMMSEFINYCGGAGPLSQVNSLNTLINSVNFAFSRETTVDRTKLEISQGLASMEERFGKERWSNEDRTDFYNISRDIMGAAPSIFSDYLNLFGKLTPSQLREFSKDIYPLYRTKLVLMEKRDDKGTRSFAKEQLMDMRRDIRNFSEVFDAGDTAFDAQKAKLLNEITGLFKERFGIIKIPEAFTSEHMRSFTNVSTYLANLHGRTPEKETILGFYLSMMVNNRWDDYRKGLEVNPDELLVPEKSEFIKKFLQERQRLNPLTPENVGIQPEEMPEFFKILQQETSNVVIGNIETIDVKLTNIVLNLRGLEDLDLYTDQLDKQRMGLLLDYGNKKIGSVVARMYQQLANPAKVAQFTEEENQIQTRITQVMQERVLPLNPQTLKENFQDGIRPLSTVVNLMSFIEETRAEPEIQSLKSLLEPSSDVIDIFKRMGEDFKPTSGAMALSQDLSYLDNLIVKREDELRPEEITLIKGYTSRIREQVVKLEGIYGQIKNKVGGLRQGGTISTNPLLKDKLDQIDGIINAQVTQQAITSTATDNLNTIIENIRECLSCTREGCNNDTDLTFGDQNKFYLFSQSETQQKGSISDELLFVEPITRADGAQGTAFILDRIYGTNTPTILENQIEAVLKKQRAIKQRFPDARISIFVSDAAISTGGTSADMLLERFRMKNVTGQMETIEVNVAESATGDHYIEFGGGSRSAGKRQANGVLLTV